MMSSMLCGTCYTIFDATTRRPLHRLTCRDDQLSKHIHAGQVAIKGRFDWSQVLGDDGVPYSDSARASEIEREKRRAARLGRIDELERKQHRRVRELLEASDPKLQEISREIAQLRADLTQSREV